MERNVHGSNEAKNTLKFILMNNSCNGIKKTLQRECVIGSKKRIENEKYNGQ
jgi:hypothetical protein